MSEMLHRWQTTNSKRAHLSPIWSIFLLGARALKMLKLRPKVGYWKPKQPKSQTNRSATYTFKILRWLKRCPPEGGEATNKGKTRRFQFQSILVFAHISWSLSHISGPSLCLHFSQFHVSCLSYFLIITILGKKGGGPMVEDAAIDKSPEFCKNIVLLVISYFVTALVMH